MTSVSGTHNDGGAAGMRCLSKLRRAAWRQKGRRRGGKLTRDGVYITEMRKELRKMSLEELWRLFPIVLSEHKPEWFVWYDEEKANLLSLLGSTIERIDHIGSTSVPGLLAKPTVDILLQVSPAVDVERLKSALTGGGWLLMALSVNSSSLVFNKGYTPDGFAERVFHLHVRPIGDHDEIRFRDYIAAHPDEAAEYAALKRRLLAEYKYNRDAYTEAKTEFIRAVTAKARNRGV